MSEPQYVMITDKEELEGCKYFYVCKTNGELLASIALSEGEFIEQEGYVVVVDYDDDTEFEDRDGTIYVDFESDDYYDI